MKVLALYGSRAGEIVDMPYMVAQRAIASGTVEGLAPPPVLATVAPPVAVATQAASAAVDSSSRAAKRGRR